MLRQSPKFLGLLRRFAAADGGNVAILFTIALVPILSFVGAAIDYSRANMARSSMQAALDSASLMVAKDLSAGTITTAQVSSKAQAYFNALYTNKEASGISVAATYTVGTSSTGSTVQINATGSIATDFMKVVGFPNMGFNASSTSTWGTQLLRVALVLDNTGSMASSGKIGALQSAAKSLVTQLSALAKNNGDVYISVVPFEVDVNVGTSNSGASWLRWDMYDTTLGSCSGNLSNPTWAQCVGQNYRWSHTPPSTNKSKWNGCVTDRDPSYDVSSTAPSSLATQFPADQDSACPEATVLPLTTNWTSVNNTISQMSPSGGTNQTIGMQWGWLSLLQQSPLNAPAEDPTKQYQHIIILFTDGLNTLNRWKGNGHDT